MTDFAKGFKGRQSSVNSTAAPLGVGGEFVGEWELAIDIGAIALLVRTDQPGTIRFEHSLDGVTTERVVLFAVTDTTEASYFNIAPRATFFRVSYVNDGVAQGLFRLTTYMYVSPQGFTFTPIETPLSARSVALNTHTVLTAKKPDGTYGNVESDASGALRVTGATGGGGGGGLTDAELRAAPVDVQGPLTNAQLRLSAVPVSGTVSVSNFPGPDESGLTNAELRATPVPVSGFPSVQPVSDNGGSLTVDGSVSVSNFPATQPVSGSVSVANFPAAQPITDNGGSLTVDGSVSVSNFPATQPVSGSVSVSNFPATQSVSGSVAVSNFPATQPVSLAGVVQVDAIGLRPSSSAVTAVGASGAAVTLTLPAAGAGLFHYITALEIVLYSAVARTGAAAPITVTSTNLPGSLAWTFATAGALGTVDRYAISSSEPLKSVAANTATTVVGPVVTSGIWRITATYFTGT